MRKIAILLVLAIVSFVVYLQEVNNNLLTEQIINAAMERAIRGDFP